MSDKTRKNLEEAVRAHYQNEIKGGLMTEFLVSIAGVTGDVEETTQYIHESSESAIHSIIGLARMASNFIESTEE